MQANENSLGSCIYVHRDESEDLSPCLSRRTINYDRTKALEESRRLFELISTPRSSTKPLASEVQLNTCFFCKVIQPLSKNNQCKLCDEMFCGRHKAELNHNCEKLTKETANYLNAKNQFKLRLRQAKSNAAR